MSQILPVIANSNPPVSPLAAQRALIREVATAVKKLNDAGQAGPKQEITFSIDRATRLPIVQVVNRATREVVFQWPAEYVLQLAAAASIPAASIKDAETHA